MSVSEPNLRPLPLSARPGPGTWHSAGAPQETLQPACFGRGSEDRLMQLDKRVFIHVIRSRENTERGSTEGHEPILIEGICVEEDEEHVLFK